MKRILYNNDTFKLLKQLDNHETNSNIGLSIVNTEMPESDFKQLESNGWYKKNNYFLIIENINQNSVKTMLNMANYTKIFQGICFTCQLNTDLLKQFIQICADFNLDCYVIYNNLNEEQLSLKGIKVVDVVYDI